MKFLQNIVADLVEKRLWPVAAVLIVGLLAVPTLLAKQSDPPAPEAPAAVVAKGADTPLTLDTTPIRRRNRGGKSRNPFQQLFKAKTEDGAQSSGALLPKSSPDASGSLADGGGLSGGQPSVVPVPKPAGTPKKKSAPKKKASLDTYKVTLRFGKNGSKRTIRDIARLTPLPSTEDPFFVFLGVKTDGRTLAFLVSADAKATGDGKCRPRDTCETIEMRAGDTEFFEVTTENGPVQYELDVVSIRKNKASSARAARKSRARKSRAGAAMLHIASAGSRNPNLLGRYRWNSRRGVLQVISARKRTSKIALRAVRGTRADL